MLQLESVENSWSFHSYDAHSAKLINPETIKEQNISPGSTTDAHLVEITSTSLIYKELLETENYPATFKDFDENCIQKLLKHDAEIYLIGTGQNSKFPDKTILKYIADNKLSIDFMDLGAASRTFNILAGEQRKVAALIFFE